MMLLKILKMRLLWILVSMLKFWRGSPLDLADLALSDFLLSTFPQTAGLEDLNIQVSDIKWCAFGGVIMDDR